MGFNKVSLLIVPAAKMELKLTVQGDWSHKIAVEWLPLASCCSVIQRNLVWNQPWELFLIVEILPQHGNRAAMQNSLCVQPADSTLLTAESITIVRCLNAKTLLVRQLPLVFIPTCLLLLTNSGVFTEVYDNYLQPWHVTVTLSAQTWVR